MTKSIEPRWSSVTSPLRVERLAVGERELGAGGAEVGEADPAVDVLAEVDDVATRSELATLRGRTQLDPPHRRRRRRAERAEVAVDDLDRLPLERVVVDALVDVLRRR